MRRPPRALVATALTVALIVALAVAGSGLSAQPGGRGSTPRHPAVAAARGAQLAFERARRARLSPSYLGGASTRCDERIGRLCYWNNNDDTPPPPERPSLARERDVLLDRLAAAAAADSADDWTAGQRVRYFNEARRYDDAVAAAAACAGTGWWCDALRGVAWHERGDHAAAAAAFDRALASMPPGQRCRWTDVSLWLEGRAASEYDGAPCGPERDRWEQRFWLVAQPLWMLPGNDLRNEFLARRVMAVVHAQSANPYGMAWGDDLAEIELRYGWPTAWSARPASPGDAGPPSVVGHEPTPSYDFVPGHGAVQQPARAATREWALDDPRARVRYAPRYTRRGFVPLVHQLARFRRGDSTLVVGAWDVTRDAKWDSAGTPRDAAASLDVGFALADSAGTFVRVVAPGRPRRGAVAVTLANRPHLASLEVVDTTRARAARARYAIEPLPRDARISDLLLLTGSAGPAADLESVLDSARGAPTVRAGTSVGLYWESYLPVHPESPATVSVRATRLGMRLRDRARSAIGLGARATPVAVRFVDVGRPDGRPGRSLALSWPSVPPGAYRLEVTVAAGADTATTAQVIRVERP